MVEAMCLDSRFRHRSSVKIARPCLSHGRAIVD